MQQYDVVIIGGGAGGLAAALAAKAQGVAKVLIIERDHELGGILNQCIHHGFGLHHFKEELTGPEYSDRVIKTLAQTDIAVLLDTMVLEITADKTIHAMNAHSGYMRIQSKAIVLAMGSRERTRGAIQVYGSRPSGVYTAGLVQRLTNMEGYMPGKEVVILGSGDIGLIMARRMILEGAKVLAVLELMPHASGLTRNIVQCLEDFDIPLLLSHTISKIHGNERIEGVTVVQVDDRLQPVPDTEQYMVCDTLLLSVGLIPENEISKTAGVTIDPRTNGPVVDESRRTNSSGIFACGNVLHIHDVVDFVSMEGEIAGRGAACYVQGKLDPGFTHETVAGEGIRYIVPQRINVHNVANNVRLYMRVTKVYKKHCIRVLANGKEIARKKALRFVPSEMVEIDLTKEMLNNMLGKEVVVEVVSCEKK